MERQMENPGTAAAEKRGTGTETLILQSAEQVFLEKGFDGAHTTEIARRAGVTHAMLHYYFRTKENLFDRVLSEKSASLSGAILDVITDEKQPLEMCLRHGIERHYDLLAANPGLPLFLFTEMKRNPGRLEQITGILRKRGAAVVSALQQKIDAAAAAGTARRVDAILLLTDIISLNVMAFISHPILSRIFSDGDGKAKTLTERRREENVEVILARIRP